jgi:hypothetical protein
MRKVLPAVTCALFLFFAACSEAPRTAEKKEEKPLEPATGLSALYKMYQVARSWGGPDTQVLKMTSMFLNEVPSVPRGRAAAWEATFVAPSKNMARSYTYSIIEVQPTLHKGVFAGPEQSWTGARGTQSPFLMAAVKVDTDKAYETALKNGEEYDKKNPDKPILILLERNTKFPNPVWRIVWGESLGTSNFSIFIDASLGDFKEKMR